MYVINDFLNVLLRNFTHDIHDHLLLGLLVAVKYFVLICLYEKRLNKIINKVWLTDLNNLWLAMISYISDGKTTVVLHKHKANMRYAYIYWKTYRIFIWQHALQRHAGVTVVLQGCCGCHGTASAVRLAPEGVDENTIVSGRPWRSGLLLILDLLWIITGWCILKLYYSQQGRTTNVISPYI